MSENFFDASANEFELQSGKIQLELPAVETMHVFGTRLTPVEIVISRRSEKDPERDAAMLEIVLSKSLDRDTWNYLRELIARKYLLDMAIHDTEFLDGLLKQVKNLRGHIPSSGPGSMPFFDEQGS